MHRVPTAFFPEIVADFGSVFLSGSLHSISIRRSGSFGNTRVPGSVSPSPTSTSLSDVQARFPAATRRADRSIVGISMGGFGTLTLALKHPELFTFVGGISSAIDVPSRPFSVHRIGQYRQHAAIFGPWGSQTRRDNDPYFLASSIDPQQMPYLFLSCGEQEGLFPANKRFTKLLQTRGFKYEFHAGPGGHDWNQWNSRLPNLFQSLLNHINVQH